MSAEIDIQKLQKLKDNLPYFASNFLKIKTKNQGTIFFNFSNIQADAHYRIQERKAQGKPCKIVFLKLTEMQGFAALPPRFWKTQSIWTKAMAAKI